MGTQESYLDLSYTVGNCFRLLLLTNVRRFSYKRAVYKLSAVRISFWRWQGDSFDVCSSSSSEKWPFLSHFWILSASTIEDETKRIFEKVCSSLIYILLFVFVYDVFLSMY